MLRTQAAVFDKEGGREWCLQNGVDVPCDSSPAWKVPDSWVVPNGDTTHV